MLFCLKLQYICAEGLYRVKKLCVMSKKAEDNSDLKAIYYTQL